MYPSYETLQLALGSFHQLVEYLSPRSILAMSASEMVSFVAYGNLPTGKNVVRIVRILPVKKDELEMSMSREWCSNVKLVPPRYRRISN